MLYALSNGLCSGEIWVEGSRRYSDPASYLITDEEWHKVRTEALSETGRATTFPVQLKSIEAETTRLLNQLEDMLNDPNSPVRLDTNGRLWLQRLPAEKVQPQAMQIGQELVAQLPSVPLSELLIEIDHATRFTSHLTHAGGAQPRHSAIEHRRNLYAAIFAQACNFGIGRMAELCGISPDTITWTTRWYLREDTLGRLTQRSSTATTAIPSPAYGEAAPSPPPTDYGSRSAVDPSPPAPTPGTS